MARLPVPGSDSGTWGNVLNDFLSQSLNADGTLKTSAVSSSGAATDSTVVHTSGSESIAGTKTFQASPVVPAPTLGGHATTKTYVDSVIPDISGKTDKSILTTKGDLYAATGASAITRVGVGGDGQVLTADSTQTAGLKWATATITAQKMYNVFSLPADATAAGCTNLAGDGTLDDQVALQALVNYLGTLYTSTSKTHVIYAPAATYAIKTTPGVAWKPGVSLIGDGPGLTVFKMINTNATGPFSFVQFDTFNQGANPNYRLSDCVFKDFEVDGSGVTGATPSYNVGVKGVNVQFGLRLRFENLYIHDCHATGLGLDFAQDTYVHQVVANNNGRGNVVTINNAGTTSGSKTVTTASATAIMAGRSITGPGIPTGTIISGVSVGASLTISKFATATASSQTMTIIGAQATSGGSGIGVGVGGYADVNITASDASGSSASSILTSGSNAFTQSNWGFRGLTGRSVTGTNIPANTTIASMQSAGQLTLSQNPTGGVSGVTITGVGSIESMNLSIVEPTCKGNGVNGLFFETQSTAATYIRSKGIKVIAPYCEANIFGLSDWGCEGLEVIGGHLVKNLSHGFFNSFGIGGSNGSNDGGIGGHLIGVRSTDNYGDGFRFTDSYSGLAPIVTAYTFTNCHAQNNYHGFNIENITTSPNTRGVIISGGLFYRNLGSGIKWSGQADQIELRDCLCKANGQDSGTNITQTGWLSGVCWDATAVAARLINVSGVDDQSSTTQDRGLYITTNAGQPSNPTIMGCNWNSPSNKNGTTFLPSPPRWSGTLVYVMNNVGMDLNARNVTGSQTFLPDDFMLIVDTSGGAATVTAPPVVIPGRPYRIKKKTADGNSLTFAANTGQGSVTGTASTTTQNAVLAFIFDGTNWQSA